MAENIVQGLFGLSPYDVQQSRLQDTNAQALQYAKLDPFQKANMSLYQAGGGLGRMGAGMMGMVDPKEQEAQLAEMGQAQIDHSTPEGLLKGAEMFNQVGNPKMAMMYAQAAQAMKASQSKLNLEAAQAHKAMVQADEEPKMRMEIARGNLDARLQGLANQVEASKQRSEDTRFSIEERTKSAEQARALQLQIAQMMDETKRFGIQSASDAKSEKEQAKLDVKDEAKKSFGFSIDSLISDYNKLNELGGMVDSSNNSVSNAIARVGSSGVGQFLGGTFGTKEQELRDNITSTIPLLVLDIKNVTGASSQQMNSNVELQNFMKAASSPKTSIKTVLKLLNNLKIKYGLSEGVSPKDSDVNKTSPNTPSLQHMINKHKQTDGT